ncbi:MAG: acyl-CoA dehydrogenase family protein [Chloroflexi bacterium]|nr:acyl-CoA dehydrogenase family protein [Chloroflexota bacterium]
MTQVTPFQSQASHDDLVERARQLVPHLRQRVQEMDKLGYLPEETVQELQEAGLFQLTVPRIYGGHQVDMRTYMDVVSEIGRGDTSTAWVVSLISGANWMAAAVFPEETQQEVFGTVGGARVTGVLAPRHCSVKRVEGGYLIEEGKWGFNSGSYHSNWIGLGIPLLNERGEVVDQGFALLPSEDVERLDDWNMIGMQGTGSTTVTVHNKFVPARRITSMSQSTHGDYLSTNLRDEVAYRYAFVPFLAIVLIYPILGAARAMLEMLLERLPSRGIQYTWYTKQAEATVTHLQVAEAAAKIDAAQLFLERASDDIDAWARRGEYMEYMSRARVRLDSGYAARLLFEAADIIIEASGGSFAAAHNPLNHFWRDIRTGSLHAFSNPTTNLELYGRLLCGQPANTPLV